MTERDPAAEPAAGKKTLEELRVEVLRAMQETRLQQEAAVRAFVSEAREVMGRLQPGEARPAADALTLLGAARERFAVTAERAPAETAGGEPGPSPKQAVTRAAEEALAAVAATDDLSAES